MQPVRVIIAAIFFVIGALIVIPAFTGGNDTSDAASTGEPTPTGTPPAASTPAESPTATRSASPTATRTPSPTATPTPSRTATPKPSTPPPSPSTPPPAPTKTTAPPARSLTVAFGRVDCPAKKISVQVTNDTGTGQGYAITRDGSLVLADQLGPNASRTSWVTLTEDERVVVRVTRDGEPVKSRAYRLNCRKAAAGDGPAGPDAAERLPHTGADDTVMVARIATGVAAMITGAIILWWGGLWPRRRENVFGRAERG